MGTRILGYRKFSMISRAIIFATVAGVFVSSAMAQDSATPATAKTKEEVEKRLAAIMPSLQMKDVMLSDAIDQLRKSSGINFHVDWKVLADNGVEKNKLVQVNLADVTLETGLRTLLSEAGSGKVDLGYIVENNVLIVSTTASFNRPDRAVTKIYDIRSLVSLSPNFSSPAICTSIAREGMYDATVATHDGGGSIFDSSTAAPSMISDRVQAVMNIITTTVSPGSWTAGVGSISVMNDQLIVTQLPENHIKLKAMLDDLRKALHSNLMVRASWVEMDQSKVSQLNKVLKEQGQFPLRMTDDLISQFGCKTVYSGQLLMSNGQRTFLCSGAAEYFTASVSPVCLGNVAAYEPVVRGAFWGPVLDIEVALDRNDNTVKTTLSSMLAAKKNLTTMSLGSTSVNEATSQPVVSRSDYQLPLFDAHQFSTTVRIPADTPVLIGGMTSPQADKDKVLYLVLEVLAEKDSSTPPATSRPAAVSPSPPAK